AAKRVNGILTAAARSVGRTRLNDALTSTQQPYDTEDYLTYADENTYYVSSAAEDRDMNVETLLQLMIQEREQQKPRQPLSQVYATKKNDATYYSKLYSNTNTNAYSTAISNNTTNLPVQQSTVAVAVSPEEPPNREERSNIEDKWLNIQDECLLIESDHSNIQQRTQANTNEAPMPREDPLSSTSAIDNLKSKSNNEVSTRGQQEHIHR
ncbi:unnamed protein product, partial [Didymodactylos carnosus]